MQELRSTDILDKEIHSDARKKAERILKQAESDCTEILKSVSENIKKAEEEKKSFYDAKIQAVENDKKSTLPLEKQRFEVSFVQQKILQGMNEYLSSLSVEKRLNLVCGKFDFSKISQNVTAYVYGFSLEDAQKFLKKKLGKNLLECKETLFNKIVIEDEVTLEKPEGIILVAQDNSFRHRLSTVQRVSAVLNKYRGELFASLFGGQL